MLAGLIRPDRGTIDTTPPSATIGLLDQEPERRVGESVRALVHRRLGIADAQHALDHATQALATDQAGAADTYDDAWQRFTVLGGLDVDQRLERAWTELGLDVGLLERDTTVLSGGEAARVGLAQLMLARFDVLMLDEPTNDLDVIGLERLEQYVLAQDAPMLIVSHDREFLRRIVTHVAEFHEHDGTLSVFGGGWQSYVDEKATARRHAQEAFADYSSERDRLRASAQQIQEWSTKGVRSQKRPNDNDKILRSVRIEGAETLASKATRAQRAIERLDAVDKPWEGWELRFTIAAAPRAGAVVARLTDAVVEAGDFTLGPVNLEIGWAERVAVVGHNGSGKTTLLGLIMGEREPTSGEVWRGPGVVTGRIDQARALFESDGSLLDAFTTATGMLNAETRTLLAKFSLGPNHVLRRAQSLSPGERTRASMALLQARGVNCLVLDEPTNHLDLTAIEQLEAGIDQFPGTVILVTHDRELLANVRLDRLLSLDHGHLVGNEPFVS